MGKICNEWEVEEMKIGVIDADLIGGKRHRFPNLACMKQSAYFKSLGHQVDLVTDYNIVHEYDCISLSKVFTNTPVPDHVFSHKNIVYGGTGFNYYEPKPLPDAVEHMMPDYSLYADFAETLPTNDRKKYTDYSIGFTTRGCFRGCSNCVNHLSRQSVLHSPVSEFLDESRPYIYLLDDNVLACKDWRYVFADLNATGKRFRFHQGMDERLLTDEKCEIIFNSNWIGDYILAFDNIADRKEIEDKLKLLRRHTDVIPKFYCFCAYDRSAYNKYTEPFWEQDIADLFERIRILMQYRCLPYVMRYEAWADSPYHGVYATIARWCNQPSFVKKKSFREFVYNTPGQNKSAPRYLEEFEHARPDIATNYFDMKWSDFE